MNQDYELDDTDGEPYPGWVRDARDARDRFNVLLDEENAHVRYIEASAGTGTRYAVVSSYLPPLADAREGNTHLVTVTAPWTDAWTFAPTGFLSISYVAEHLCRGRKPSEVNGGDIMALTLAVRRALGRDV